jgi:transcriptional regulator with XRE-family HTH domain
MTGEHRTRDDDADSRARKARKFGEVVTAAARAAGYDVDRPRGGGKKKLAEAAGMSFASTSRMLAGKAIPDPEFFPGLADALGIPLRQLLIDSELAPADTFVSDVEPGDRMPLAEAAARIGIRNPTNVRLFVSFAQSLLAEERPHERSRAAVPGKD